MRAGLLEAVRRLEIAVDAPFDIGLRTVVFEGQQDDSNLLAGGGLFLLGGVHLGASSYITGFYYFNIFELCNLIITLLPI